MLVGFYTTKEPHLPVHHDTWETARSYAQFLSGRNHLKQKTDRLIDDLREYGMNEVCDNGRATSETS